MRKLWVAVGAFLLAINIGGAGLALAASGDSISRSYSSSTELRPGSIVSADKNSGSAVLTEQTNIRQLIGVVVDRDTSLVAVDPDEAKAQVANSGQSKVLVSSVNGAIRSGDKIAISPFAGVGMKALADGYIIGRAVGSFDASSDSVFTETATDKNGDRKTISMGYVSVDLAPGYDSTITDSGKNNGLQDFVESLTGRTISTPRIIVSLIIVVLTVAVIAVLVYAAIFGSIISIGRNPLARDSILKALLYALFIAGGAVFIAFILIYLLLR
jgi:hypothetical protein